MNIVNIKNILKKEKQLFIFIFKNPLIWGLYLCSFLLILLFFYSEFYLKNYLILDFSRFLNFQTSSNFFDIGIPFFFYSFIVLSILLIPFLTLAEIYQKKFKENSTNIFLQIIIDFFYAIPYLIILSFFWTIFIIVSSKENKNTIGNLKPFFIYIIISALTYWTYYSLAKIAYDDKKSLFPAENPIKFYKEKWNDILKIWLFSGFYFAIPFGILIVVYFLNITLGYLWIFSQEIVNIIFENISILWITWLIFWVLWNIISSQLNILNYYIKETESLSKDFIL